MSLVVVHPGLSSTFQDLGRPGNRRFGVPQGGAADQAALGLANALVGNERGAVAIEWTGIGGSYRASACCRLAIAGAPFHARVLKLDGQVVELVIPQSFVLEQDDTLVIGGTPSGLRAYLAVAGGWQVPLLLGSGSAESTLAIGQTLESETSPDRPFVRRVRPSGIETSVLRILPGPDLVKGSHEAEWQTLIGPSGLRVLDTSNRMGLRLAIERRTGLQQGDRPSAPVLPGTIQHTGEQLIVLGVAGGTMGGYLHLAQVISADIDLMGQIRPGQRIQFAQTTLDEARSLGSERDNRVERTRRIVAVMCRG